MVLPVTVNVKWWSTVEPYLYTLFCRLFVLHNLLRPIRVRHVYTFQFCSTNSSIPRTKFVLKSMYQQRLKTTSSSISFFHNGLYKIQSQTARSYYSSLVEVTVEYIKQCLATACACSILNTATTTDTGGGALCEPYFCWNKTLVVDVWCMSY